MSSRSESDLSTGPADPVDEKCFDCGVGPASPGRPLIVNMYRVQGKSGGRLSYKEIQVQIPICETCRVQESSIETRRNLSAAITLFIPLLAGVVFGFIQGELLSASLFGLGAGFFLSLIVRTTVGYKRRSREHPEVKSLLKRGWIFDAPGS
jgi:hypothetical protein